MSVDPKILAQMRRVNAPPEDDGSEGAVLEDEPEFNEPDPRELEGKLMPTLRGSPKQVKWALTIRFNAVRLQWPADIRAMLLSIDDASWWIANKDIVTTMKFKAPSAHQIVGGTPPPKGRPQPGSSPAPAASVSPHQKRLDDALLWAASVSRHPTLAQAAILSCLRFAYPKGAMRDQITAKARELLAQANMEVNRDTDAIQLMLSKE